MNNMMSTFINRFPKNINLLKKSNIFLSRNMCDFKDGNTNETKQGVRLPGVKDMKDGWKAFTYDYNHEVADMIPREVDILIIGGGVIGWSVAYFLRHNTTFSVAVVERDPSHTRCASVLGIGAVRQQFSEPENIQMSLFGAEFLRNAREHLSILDLDPPDLQFHPHGFLTLASDAGFEELKSCFDIQKQMGAKVELLTKNDIHTIWPWMNVADVGGAIHGYENEGWFDSWQLLNSLKRKACSLGAQEIHGEMIGAEYTMRQNRSGEVLDCPTNILVRLPDGNVQPVQMSQLVVSAGPWSAAVGRMLNMGDSASASGPIPLPVEARTQHIFVVNSSPARTANCTATADQLPGIDCPFIVDYDGLNVRRDRLGGNFLVFLDTPPLSGGLTAATAVVNSQSRYLTVPLPEDEAGLDVEFDLFESTVRPQLARRIPQLATATLRYGWAAPLDHNYVDGNLILGPHPRLSNVFFACGSSGHGIEHSLAIGQALYEMISYSDYKTMDLRNFGFQRFYENHLVFEKEIF